MLDVSSRGPLGTHQAMPRTEVAASTEATGCCSYVVMSFLYASAIVLEPLMSYSYDQDALWIQSGSWIRPHRELSESWRSVLTPTRPSQMTVYDRLALLLRASLIKQVVPVLTTF
jgi:hypothetical protein